MARVPTGLRIVLAVAAAYTAATCAAVIVILLWTQALETLAAGLLIPMFVIPALTGHAFVSAWSRFNSWRRAVYLALLLPILVFLLWEAVMPSQGARNDASDQCALAILLPLAAAGIVGLVTLESRLVTSA